MRDALAGLDGVITVVVVPATGAALRPVLEAAGPDAVVLSDPAWETYRLYGLRRASFREVWLAPRVWWRYGTLLARGRRYRRPRQDTLQLGGDAIVDTEGRLAWHRPSRSPIDRPPAAEIRDRVRETLGRSPGT